MARNITRNRVTLEGNTVPSGVRFTSFQGGGSVINLTIVTQTDVWQMVNGKLAITGTKPEFHNIVIKGGSEKLAAILKERSLFCRVEGELRYREWERELKSPNSQGVWSIVYDQNSHQPVTVKTTIPEIIITGPKSEFHIVPCVNSQGAPNKVSATTPAEEPPAPDFQGVDEVPW